MLKTLLILSIISFSFAFDHRCGNTGFQCKVTETCCRTIDQEHPWKCFNGFNLTCCSDGITVCPNKTKCDTDKKTCQPLNMLLNLLDLTASPVLDTSSYNADRIDREYTNPTDFIKGFLIGTELFHKLDKCDSYNFSSLSELIISISEVIRNLDESQDIIGSVIDLVFRIKKLKEKIEKMKDLCAETAADMKTQVELLFRYLSYPDYPKKLMDHTLQNLDTIARSIKEYVSNFKSYKQKKAGQVLGGIIKYCLFWNIEQMN